MSQAPNYRLAAERAAKRHGIDPAIFVAQLKQESGLAPGKTSPKGAQGIAQFIPSTAKAYGVNLHDGRVADDLDGAARYMADNLKRAGGDYTKALSIYNSGKADGYRSIPETARYVTSILTAAKSSPAVKPAAGALAGGVAPRPATTKTTSTFDAQGFDAAKRRALVGALIAKHNPNSILLRAGALTTQAPDRATFETTSTKTTPGKAPTARTPASASSAPARNGKVTIAAGAERNGIGLQRPILGLLNQISAAGKRPLTVTTGTNHNRLTVDGNVSDHWEGNAADLGVPVDSQKGDLIAAHAIQVAGGLPFDKALAMARAGGIHNFQTKQGKVQVIWRTYEGGNHHNHVHIGLNPHA